MAIPELTDPAVEGLILAPVPWEVLVGQPDDTVVGPIQSLAVAQQGSGSDDLFLQRSGGGNDLEGRPWGIDSTDGVVDQGVVEVTGELRVGLGRDPLGEEVVVVAGQGDQGQDGAIPGIHGNGHACAPVGRLKAVAQRLLHRPLQLQVNGQNQVVARNGGLWRANAAHFATIHVHNDGPVACFTAQCFLKGRFQARQANLVRLSVSLLNVYIHGLTGNRPCVADDGSGQCAAGILSTGLHLNLDTW